MAKTKQLRQATTGRIFTWTPTLAKRHDMSPWPPITTGGLIEPDSKVQLIGLEYSGITYKVAKDSVDDFNALASQVENQKTETEQLKNEIAKLKFGRIPDSAQPEPPVETQPEETEPLDMTNVSEQERLSLIVEAIGKLVEMEDNKKHFSRNGLPKVQAIEMICDFDISALERTDAWEMFNKK